MGYMGIIVSTMSWDSFYGVYAHNRDSVYGYNHVYNAMILFYGVHEYNRDGIYAYNRVYNAMGLFLWCICI